MRLLLVEDSKADAMLLIGTLKLHGFDPVYERVQETQTLQDALRDQHWDIILSDYQMPKLTGLEALKICKEKMPDVPFVMVTGAIGEETAAQVMKAGAVDFILKSNLSRLSSVVERELRETEIRKQNRDLEASLLTSEQEFKAVFDTTMDALLIADNDGRYLAANPAACQLLGRASNEIIGDSVEMLFSHENHSVFEQMWFRFLSERHMSGELLLACRQDEPCYVNFRAIAHFLPSKHLFVLQDITSRKQAQQALEHLNKSLEQRVVERTSELAKVNVVLSVEVEERKQAELALKQTLEREQLLRKIM